MPEGAVVQTIGLESAGAIAGGQREDSLGPWSKAYEDFVAVPSLVYLARFGVTDWMDVGLRVATAASASMDVKLELADTEVAALALQPSIQSNAWTGVGADLRCVGGWTPGAGATVFGGPRTGIERVTVSGRTVSESASRSEFLYVGGVLGLEVRRASAAFVLESSLQRTLGDEYRATLLSIAAGFSFGRQW